MKPGGVQPNYCTSRGDINLFESVGGRFALVQTFVVETFGDNPVDLSVTSTAVPWLDKILCYKVEAKMMTFGL